MPECFESSRNLACRQQFDRRFQGQFPLPNNLIKPGDSHSGFLELLERPARFDALMLADIADQKHPIIIIGTGNSLITKKQAAQGEALSGLVGKSPPGISTAFLESVSY